MEAGSPRRSARQRGGAAKGAGECERWRRESPEEPGGLRSAARWVRGTGTPAVCGGEEEGPAARRSGD